MSNETIACETETAGAYPQTLRVRKHVFRADTAEAAGGSDSAPGPHDYFDAALAACKALTATWYAKQKGMALERVDVQVGRDDAEERVGKYRLHVKLEFFGALSDDERKRLHAAVARCPVHKLMTSTEVLIETAPLDADTTAS